MELQFSCSYSYVVLLIAPFAPGIAYSICFVLLLAYLLLDIAAFNILHNTSSTEYGSLGYTLDDIIVL